MALQPILGYPSDYRAPFTAVEINFAQGPSTSNGPGRTVIYIGPKTSAGNGTAGTVYKISQEQDAIDNFGVGSPLHRMIRKHLLADKGATMYAMAYAASSGSGVATATGTITVTMSSGSNPTAAGLMTSYVCGEQIVTAFTTADTVTTIGDALVAQINAKQYLPCTAANSGGVVTLTAKVAGASQGDGTVGVIRFRSAVQAGKNVVVATSGAALGLGSGTAGADGATTETAGLTSALANIPNSRYYYMGFSLWSSTAVGLIKTHVANKSLANPGLRCCSFTGYTHTQSALTTIAIAQNYERHYVAWQLNSEVDTAELAANLLAIHRVAESIRGGFVHDDYREPNWLIPAAYAESDWPTPTNINDAITDGITPIASNQFGSRVVMSVSTRSKNAAGTIDDFRATERHRISFMDDLADTLLARDAITYAGFKLQADQLLPDGSVNVNQRVPPRTLTPSLYAPFPANIIDEFAADGVIQDAASWKSTLRVNIDPLNASRLEVGFSGRTIDIRHQATFRLNETSPG